MHVSEIIHSIYLSDEMISITTCPAESGIKEIREFFIKE